MPARLKICGQEIVYNEKGTWDCPNNPMYNGIFGGYADYVMAIDEGLRPNQFYFSVAERDIDALCVLYDAEILELPEAAPSVIDGQTALY